MIAPTAQLHYVAEDPDVRLMLRVRGGDHDAFQQLIGRHHSAVIRVISYLLGSHQQSEDLAQEVYLRIYRARASYQPQSRYRTWLFTIVNNVVHTAKGKLARRREFQLDQRSCDQSETAHPLTFLAVATQHLQPSRSLESSEAREAVHAAISLLNWRQRMAVELRHLHGLSHVEIAQRLNSSPEAVKSLLHRAIENLRDHLHPYMDDGSAVRRSVTRTSSAGQCPAARQSTCCTEE